MLPLMRTYIVLILSLLVSQAGMAQTVSRSYRNKSMSDVLVNLSRATGRYKIAFIYNELEDFTVTKTVTRSTVPDAVRAVIGFYPIRMTVCGDSLILVECTQKEPDRLIGRLVDAGKEPVVGATVRLLSPDDSTEINVGVSNESGWFVIPAKTETVLLCVSAIGYEPVRYRCEVGNVGTLTLSAATEHLAEVTVTGSARTVSLDRDVYLPNSRQRAASGSGLDLLAHIMIPQLRVNRLTGSVTAVDSRNVTVCVDGRETTAKELDRLRPKDILRVEFIDQPKDEFAGKEAVVNIILRHYDYGGYTALNSKTQFMDSRGDHSVRTTLDHKRMRYTVMAGGNYSNDRDRRTEQTEHFVTDMTYDKTTEEWGGNVRENSLYGQMSADYRGDRLRLYGQAGLVWSRTPGYDRYSDILYSGDIAGRTGSQSSRYSRNIKPYAKLYAKLTLPAGQMVKLDAALAFGRNTLNSTYTEADGYGIVRNADEKTLNSIFTFIYNKQLSDKNSFSLMVYEAYRRYRDHYSGTVASDQYLCSSEFLVFPEYRHTFGRRLSVMLRPLGFSLPRWKAQDFVQNNFSSRAAYTLRYKIDGRNVLSNSMFWGNNFPSPSYQTALEVPLNRYETLRGNPELKKVTMMTTTIGHSLTLDGLSLYTYARYDGYYNFLQRQYEPEGGILVHTFRNAGDLQFLELGSSATLPLLGKSLQLQGGLAVSVGDAGGPCPLHATTWKPSLSFLYSLGSFSLSGSFDYRTRELDGTGYVESRPDYSLSASYRYKELFVEAGCRRILETRPCERSYIDTPAYSSARSAFSDRNGRMAYVRLSWSFDFGRKTERQNISVDMSTSSAILHQ